MTKRPLALLLVGVALLGAALACSTDDLNPNRRSTEAPTATVSVFATTTPGGVISVWLSTPPGAGEVGVPPAGAAVIGPVGTATAAAAVVATATAQAAAPIPQPTYQPGECPMPRNPPPPTRPATFAEYPAAVARYLSAGGPTTLLEGALRTWGAITDTGGLVKVDTDVTGDGGPEVIITLYDPAYADRRPQPGQLLIFGCDNGGYRLLYASPQDPNVGLPILLRVGDMTGDALAEVAFQAQRCEASDRCIGEAQILNWDSALGNFRLLNAGIVSAPNAQFGIGDIDQDGILELSITSLSAGTGPTRITNQVWDWNGQNYLLALNQPAPPQYRIHAVHDADALLAAGNYAEARDAFERVLTDETLLPWAAPNERAYLNAYALYRLLLIAVLQGQDAQAQVMLDRLNAEFAPGLPGSGYAELARAFWADYTLNRNLSTACAAARNVAAGGAECAERLRYGQPAVYVARYVSLLTQRCSNPMTDLMAHFETRLEFLIDLLSQLIACESPSTDKAAVDRLGALVAARCRALGAEVTVEPRAAVGDVILAKWNAAAPGKPILTLAHMDTVHPPGALAVMPLRREADRLYGPGAVDMKGGIAVLLGVVAELQGLGLFPNRPIWSLFTTDEELGSAHSAGIIQEVARQVGLVLVLEGAMYPEKLKTGRKSTGTFTIGVTGRPAHAGVEPEKGVNAIIEMARQVERIGALADPAQGTTVTPTVIHGGDRTNVVPAEATLIVDVRVATAAEGERLTCAMQGLAPILPGASLSVKGGFDRPPMERNALMLQTFACAAEIAARIGHPPLEEGTTGGGSDGNYTAALGIPTLDGVGPGGNGAHTQDEYVWIPTMARRAALLAGLLRYWPAL